MEEGSESALKDYYRKCQDQLDELVKLTIGELSKGDRKKVITLCTIDTHARDVVQKLIDDKVETAAAFQWQSQLRYSFDEATKAVRGSICDFDFPYAYEYIGNCGCLVITPLTDRCYITLTQAQRLVLGGAPAGPAGTGKTESVKDLGRALGVMVYVFNCSDQMDYRIMGQIYKGLAQTGTWGCFDEFNRIPVEVRRAASAASCIVWNEQIRSFHKSWSDFTTTRWRPDSALEKQGILQHEVNFSAWLFSRANLVPHRFREQKPQQQLKITVWFKGLR